MTPRCIRLMLLASAALLCAGAAPGAQTAASAPAAPKDPAERKALEDRLEQEKARLARLQDELKQVQQGTASPKANPAPTPDAAPAKGDATSPADPALLHRPSLAAADVLYRLGRYAQARAVYEAAARLPGAAPMDRTWALLQAGNCARRLHDFEAALAHFQTILADYPDGPWFLDQTNWALRTVKWERRWHRQSPQTGE